MGALSELGLSETDGDMKIEIRESPLPTLKRVEAIFLSRRIGKFAFMIAK
jgi:hypothetical protein